MKNLAFWINCVFLLFGCLTPFTGSFGQRQTADERLDTYDLAELSINEIPIEENIMPNSRPFDSVYGDARSILQTPRSVTIISRAQLDAIGIQDPRDFSKLTSSSYTTSNFGAPTTPSIRGQFADTFYNGMRRGLTSNGNGMPINFNAVESVNIVKGPAGVRYGTSQYSGGYVDYVTKRPYFDIARGEASLTVGSYDQWYWNFDYGAPISENTAWRMSYSGEESGSYYEFGKKNLHALYMAWSYTNNDNYSVDANFEVFQADYTENFGINRPTPELLKDLTYYPNAGTDEEYQAYADGITGGFTFTSLGSPVKISPRKRLLRPGDDSFGRQISAQLIQRLQINDNVEMVNNTALNWIDRDTFSSYHYSEVLRDNYSLDNRTEFIIEQGSATFITGAHLRYQSVEAYNHFGSEPANAHDLTRDPYLRFVPDFNFQNLNPWEVPGDFTFSAVVPNEEPPGILSARYYQPFNGDSGKSNARSFGPFVQSDFNLGDGFSLLAGGRMDMISADFRNLFDSGINDSANENLFNYNLSLVKSFNEELSGYITYNYSETHGTGTGGGLVPGDGAAYNEAFFDQGSEMVEVGIKGTADEGKVFWSLAAFDRDFSVPGIGGASDSVVEAKGFEAETNIQPAPGTFMTFSYSYLDARTNDAFSTTPAMIKSFQTFPNILTPTFGDIMPLPGKSDYKLPGAPNHLFNTAVNYKHDSGWGVFGGLVVTGPMNIAYDGITEDPLTGNIIEINPIEIPWQHSLDLTIFYAKEDWEFRFTVYNVTDKLNFSPPNPTYGNGSIVVDLPRRVSGTVRYRF